MEMRAADWLHTLSGPENLIRRATCNITEVEKAPVRCKINTQCAHGPLGRTHESPGTSPVVGVEAVLFLQPWSGASICSDNNNGSSTEQDGSIRRSIRRSTITHKHKSTITPPSH
ncbi:hypothetical protein E4U55_001279 [Claviceps digitariae]|nr:hypothetical protein E4U55_001279 [Claviceps digitariae]